jgi:putative sterol carrier protein
VAVTESKPRTIKTEGKDMSDMINAAVAALNAKMDGGLDGSAKFVIEGEGAIMMDGDGVREGDDEADVTLTADADTFQSILMGDLDPTSAFMSGKLAVDGDMGMAMKLGTVLG